MTPSHHFARVLAFAATLVIAAPSLQAQVSGAGNPPAYTSQSIVNAATQTVEALAPNTIATLYGTDLAFSTRSVASTDIVRGTLPTNLDGVAVWVNAIPCSLFFVSPTQINFLVPYLLTAQTVSVIVARNGQAGLPVNIQLNNTSPGLFLWGGNNAIATHINGLLISALLPARPGETIVIYAAGLGRTAPDTPGGQLATAAFPIYYLSQLQVLLNGVPCPPGSILYAGLAPGFAGLYQINLILPPDLAPSPEIRIVIGAQAARPPLSWPSSRPPKPATNDQIAASALIPGFQLQ